MDLFISLLRTNCGHNSIWVVVDKLTKLVNFIPTRKDMKTFELARFFIKHLYRLYDLPIDMVLDGDRKFDGHLWR